MSTVSPNPAARLRGAAAGLLTAALAVAAHGVGSGAPPTGATAASLAVLAATIGALAASIARAAQPRVLLVLLASGQLFGHLVLGVGGHSHGSTTSPPVVAMLAAHVAAIAAGAALIGVGDRLYRAVSRVLRAVVRTVVPPVLAVPVSASGDADQPLRAAHLLASSMSHRGPPVGLAR